MLQRDATLSFGTVWLKFRLVSLGFNSRRLQAQLLVLQCVLRLAPIWNLKLAVHHRQHGYQSILATSDVHGNNHLNDESFTVRALP
jgi:hypothetical protein